MTGNSTNMITRTTMPAGSVAPPLSSIPGGSWNTGAGVNFTVNGLAYDLNGIFTSMKQYGLKGSSCPLIDNLTYTYSAHSNKLSKVTDAANDPNSTFGDFHYSGTKGSTDYAYDYNGNPFVPPYYGETLYSGRQVTLGYWGNNMNNPIFNLYGRGLGNIRIK